MEWKAQELTKSEALSLLNSNTNAETRAADPKSQVDEALNNSITSTLVVEPYIDSKVVRSSKAQYAGGGRHRCQSVNGRK